MLYQDWLNMQGRAFSTCPQNAAASKAWWFKGSSTWSKASYNIYTQSSNINIIMHSKNLHKLNVLGNVFVKFISPTERLPHHISRKDMPVSRSTSSQKEQGFLPFLWLLNNIKSACRPLVCRSSDIGPIVSAILCSSPPRQCVKLSLHTTQSSPFCPASQ